MRRLMSANESKDAICRVELDAKNLTWRTRARIALTLLDAAQYLVRPGNRAVELRMGLRPAADGSGRMQA